MPNVKGGAFIFTSLQIMGWLKPSLFVVALISGLATGSFCGRTYSNLEVVQCYEQCVLNRLSSSQFYTEEDRVHMNKIVTETNDRMQLLPLDPTNVSNARTMLRLFAAALSNLVADNDVLENLDRKEAYISAIELCSLSLPELIAEELIQEVKRILAPMKNTRVSYSVNSAKETPVSPLRREEFSEMPLKSSTPEDNKSISRSKRSPQAASFNPMAERQPNQSLDRVIANILLNSNTFPNIFKAGLTQRDALYYARSMVESGLMGYHFSVIQEAVNSVANAISTLTSSANSRDYALAIGKSIVSVLNSRQLAYFANGVGIGNALVLKLQDMIRSDNPVFSFSASFHNAPSSLPWDGRSGSGSMSNQPRVMSPSRVNSGFMETKQPPVTIFTNPPSDATQFQNNLEFFLSQSNKMQSAFCNGPFPDIFGMVSAALSDYGLSVSTKAASIVSDALNSMDPGLACVQYLNVISETVSSVLKDNGLLSSADAQLIAETMASNLNQRQEFKSPPFQNQQGFSSRAYSSNPRGSQQDPPFFSEFSFPEIQLPALGPEFSSPVSQTSDSEFQFEPVEYPISETSERNPMDKTDFEDIPGSQMSPFQTSDKAQIPAQETRTLEQIPMVDPNFEPAVPDYYSRDTIEPSFGTAALGQTNQGESSPFVPRTDEYGGQRFESPDISTSVNNSPNESQNSSSLVDSSYPDYETPPEAGPFMPENPQVSLDNSGSERKTNIDSSSSSTTTELPSQEETVQPESESEEAIQTSTTVDIIETTTPGLYLTTVIDSMSDSRKIAKIFLDDIYSALRTLNSSSTSKGDKQPRLSSTSSDAENNESPSDFESTTFKSVPQVDKRGRDETESTTIASNIEDAQSNRKSSVDLQPSFWPTSVPDSDDASPAERDFKNGTDSSEETAEDNLQLRDPTVVFAEDVSSIASSSIDFIRSEDFDLKELCVKLKDLASVVDIPPLDSCDEIALIDYLLNVLKAVTFILRSV